MDSSADFPGKSLMRVIFSMPSRCKRSRLDSASSQVNLLRLSPVAYVDKQEISCLIGLNFTIYASYSDTSTSFGADHALTKHFNVPTSFSPPAPTLLADSAFSINSATYSFAALVWWPSD